MEEHQRRAQQQQEQQQEQPPPHQRQGGEEVVAAAAEPKETPEIGDFPEFRDSLWEKLELPHKSSTKVLIETLDGLHAMKKKFEKDRAGLSHFYCKERRLIQLVKVWRQYEDDATIVVLTCRVLCHLSKWGCWIKDDDDADDTSDNVRDNSINDAHSGGEEDVTTTTDKNKNKNNNPVVVVPLDRCEFLIRRKSTSTDDNVIDVMNLALRTMHLHRDDRDVQEAVTSLLVYLCYNDVNVRRNVPARRIADAVVTGLRNHPDAEKLVDNSFQLVGDLLTTIDDPADLLDANGCMGLIRAFDRFPAECILGHAWYSVIRRATHRSVSLRAAVIDLGAIQTLTNASRRHVKLPCHQMRVSRLRGILQREWDLRLRRVDSGLAERKPNASADETYVYSHVLAREFDMASSMFYCLRSSAEDLVRQ